MGKDSLCVLIAYMFIHLMHIWRDEWKPGTMFISSVFIPGNKSALPSADLLKCKNLPCHSTCSHLASVTGHWSEDDITERISSLQPQGPSMETWIMRSVWWLFTFLSLFLRHQVVKAFITSAATAPSSPSWWSRTGHTQRSSRKSLLKTEGMEQSAAGDPTLVSPVQEHDLVLRLCSAVYGMFQPQRPPTSHSHPPTAFPWAVNT